MGDHFDIIGGGICGAFVVFGLLSVVVYKPWRQWVESNTVERLDVEHIRLQSTEKAVEISSGPIPDSKITEK